MCHRDPKFNERVRPLERAGKCTAYLACKSDKKFWCGSAFFTEKKEIYTAAHNVWDAIDIRGVVPGELCNKLRAPEEYFKNRVGDEFFRVR